MKPRGVSIIELIIYVALASVILLAMGTFTIDVLLGRQKVAVIDKQKQTTRVAWDRMNREIERAIGINVGSSTFGSHPGVLSLIEPDAANNPTVFDVSSGRLRMTQGANPAIFLTPANITVSNLTFTNLSNGTTYTVRVQFNATANLASGNTNYTAASSYQSSIFLHN